MPGVGTFRDPTVTVRFWACKDARSALWRAGDGTYRRGLSSQARVIGGKADAFFLTTGRSSRGAGSWGEPGPDPGSADNESVLDRLRATGEDQLVVDHLVRLLSHDSRGPDDL